MQSTPPYEVQNLKNIKQIEAGYQSSIVLTDDGYVYYFGNSMNNDYNEFHGLGMTDDNLIEHMSHIIAFLQNLFEIFIDIFELDEEDGVLH